MKINVTIHETQGITSGFIVCNIVAPLTYDQFANLGYDKNSPNTNSGTYNPNNAGELLATQKIPAPVSADTTMSFTGLATIPYLFVEFMASPDGTRQKGVPYNVDGFNFQGASFNNLTHKPTNGSSFIQYTITF